MKKNLFEIDYNKSSEACFPCASECKKIDRKINNRELSNLKDEDVTHIFSRLRVKNNFLFNDRAHNLSSLGILPCLSHYEH